MFFVTFNEYHSGIYKSQVIDVVNFLNNKFGVNLRLIAFIPLDRNGKHKSIIKRIKSYDENAIIIPTLPLKYIGWKYNVLLLGLLCVWYRPKALIAREIFAAYLGLKLRRLGLVRKVCLDSRGPNVAQHEEYGIYPPILAKELNELESMAVNETDFQMSVTEAMVDYWRRYFNYKSSTYVVIPCNVGDSFILSGIDAEKRKRVREDLGYAESDIVLVYSGSLYGWQSFDIVRASVKSMIEANNRIKILFLAKEEENISALIEMFPAKITRKWLNHEDVPIFLRACDYGMLLRNTNVTNSVSISTKFAEYLASGLPIIVSHNLAITAFIKAQNCGRIVDVDNRVYPEIYAVSMEEKYRMIELAKKYFSKDSEANIRSYRQVLDKISR